VAARKNAPPKDATNSNTFEPAREGRRATERGDETRDRILEAALKLFRKRGFDRATVRDVARAAGVAPSAAYYYYPSKDALVLAWYARVQREHDVRAAAAASLPDLRERLRATFRAKLDIVAEDRALLGGVFRYVGEAQHPLSPLGPHTRALREQSVATFARALGDHPLPADLASAVPTLLWTLHLGFLLLLVYDDSPGLARTYRLADDAANLVCTALGLTSLPPVSAVLAPVWGALRDAGLLPGVRARRV